MTTIIFVREIAERFPLKLTIIFFVLMLMVVIDLASIVILAPVVDVFLGTDKNMGGDLSVKLMEFMSLIGIPITLVGVLSALLLINFLKVLINIISQRVLTIVQYAIVGEIMHDTFKSMLSARWEFFSGSKQGTILNSYMVEMGNLGKTTLVLGNFFAAIIQIVFFLSLPFFLSWQVTSYIIVFVVLVLFPFMMMGSYSKKFGSELTDIRNQIGGIIQESFGSAKIILGFGNQQKQYLKLSSEYNKFERNAVRTQTFNEGIKNVYYPLGVAAMAVALFASQKFELPISDTAVLLYAFMRSMPLFGDIVNYKHRLDHLLPSYRQVISLKSQAESLRQFSGERSFDGFNTGVQIEDLTFSHPTREPVLRKIAMQFQKGHMVAIVGESGSGKSTLIDLVMGFHEPVSGLVMIDGIPLQEYDIQAYRKRIGYVPQESTLFNMTIADNLRWANEGASDEEIRAACKLANADAFIESFPDGYDTIVGDQGMRLSGGQAQRISLARAVIRKPDLLILDEATSSLDSTSERLIQQAIENIVHETTAIVVAHRLSTIKNSDYIYVLGNKGRVVEEGTYSHLLTFQGVFARMIESQQLGAGEHVGI